MAMAREADPRLAEIGAKIRIFRNRLGWTIENLALEADLTTPQVSEIERGLRSAGMRAYLAIADALNVSLSDIQPDGMKEATVDPVLHAAYDNGSGRTVFWLPDCRFFEFLFTKLDNSEKDEQMTDHKKMGKKYMRAQPWHMAVMLMGDHRVEENMANRTGSRVGTREETETENGSREDEVEARMARKLNPSAFGNPETIYIRKEEVTARLNAMTETQRRIFIAYYGDGMTQEQIGDELGIAHQTVSKHLKAAEKKMANFQ